MTIKFPTRLEVLYVPELIRILMLETAFIKILSSFGEKLLQNFHLAREIENFGVNQKINRILNQYCQKYGSEANYERICEILVENFGLASLAEKVKIEANNKRPRTIGTTGTKIEYNEILSLVKILFTNENLIGDLEKFKNLLGVQTEWQPNSTPKTQLNHVMHNFHGRFPQRATYDFLIDILENEMGLRLHGLAVEVRKSKGLVGQAQSERTKHVPIPAPAVASSSQISKGFNRNQTSQPENLLFEEKIKVRPESECKTLWKEQPEFDDSKYALCEPLEMSEGETGINYETIFGKHFDSSVIKIVVEDPYLIYGEYQVDNFYEFLDLALKMCPNLREMSVVTAKRNANENILQQFENLCSTHKSNLEFNWTFNETLHDRRVRLFYLKQVHIEMGRGLDIRKTKVNSSGERECRPGRICTIYCNPTDNCKIVECGQTVQKTKVTTTTSTTTTPPSPKPSTSGTQQQSNGNNQVSGSPRIQKPTTSGQSIKKKKPSLAHKALSAMSGGKFGKTTQQAPLNIDMSNAGASNPGIRQNIDGIKSGTSGKKKNK